MRWIYTIQYIQKYWHVVRRKVSYLNCWWKLCRCLWSWFQLGSSKMSTLCCLPWWGLGTESEFDEINCAGDEWLREWFGVNCGCTRDNWESWLFSLLWLGWGRFGCLKNDWGNILSLKDFWWAFSFFNTSNNWSMASFEFSLTWRTCLGSLAIIEHTPYTARLTKY